MYVPGSSIASLRCLLAKLQTLLVGFDKFFGLRLMLGNCSLTAELGNLFLIIGHGFLLPRLKPTTHSAVIVRVIGQEIGMQRQSSDITLAEQGIPAGHSA
jgi:hypothetical protein